MCACWIHGEKRERRKEGASGVQAAVWGVNRGAEDCRRANCRTGSGAVHELMNTNDVVNIHVWKHGVSKARVTCATGARFGECET